MPDIAMCASMDCPIAATCRRHEASGTKPARMGGEVRQCWQHFHWRRDSHGDRVICGGHWPVATTPAMEGADHG